MKKAVSKLKKSEQELTPLMSQYYDVKAKYPDALVLFRVGDFYESFGEDAVSVAGILNIILTARNNGGVNVELAGFPYHSLDVYLPRLVRAGYRVAICDQLEKPVKGKKLVRRGVTNVVTPGLTIDETLLQQGKNNYLASLHRENENWYGISFLDLSTGEFIVSEGEPQVIDSLLQRFLPAEIIFAKKDKKLFQAQFQSKCSTFSLDDWVYHSTTGAEKLLQHFKVASLKGFGIDSLNAAITAAGAILYYLELNENKAISHINKISRIPREEYMWLDKFTIRNLELVPDQQSESKSLLEVLDKCYTPMGSRRLKKWILMPLLSREKILSRQEIVGFFIEDPDLSRDIGTELRRIGDLERLVTKSAMGKIQPREILMLSRAIEASEELRARLVSTGKEHLNRISESINPCISLSRLIRKTISEDAPAIVSKGNFILPGNHEELDEYRYIIANNREMMAQILANESKLSHIPNLKLGFNNVFGYYFEVTARHRHIEPPEHWIRKQTLANGERYITPELKELELKVLEAESKIQELEEKIFLELIISINEHISTLQANCDQLSKLDCLLSFATQAVQYNYTKPILEEGDCLEIIQGRHPIIEVLYGHDRQYIPNDLFLDPDESQVLIITGPNMAGKSAILRQTGLIALMSQMGSYVPAKAVKLGLIDKLFTRVGASDNILGGESTFMVEMNETASIINNISHNSLILLDEIGRGTSTYDGISIAWALAEYIHDNLAGRPKTLFATHYHELNELENKLERVKNFKVAIKELKSKIVFLYQLVPGSSEHSFGIHVAKMAGLPLSVTNRAQDIMKRLEEQSMAGNGNHPDKIKAILTQLPAHNYQLSIFETSDPSIGAIRELLLQLNPEAMTPIECLIKLKELQNLAQSSLVG
ncbi:MAG TPA: DNA mismatch repair protein MutS [Saprospiraceae bacterium]|nr:DNA mismatch repair protein MutS [Saprospiraceae bacterium]